MSDTLQEGEDRMGDDGSKDWCDDCHGYTHMPWCPSYRAADEISDEEYRQSSSTHQPAARGGGEGWKYVETKYSAEIGLGRFTLRPHWIGLAEANEIEMLRNQLRKLVQYQSLVAERESLEVIRKQHEGIAKDYNFRTCACDYCAILNKQRSTSE